MDVASLRRQHFQLSVNIARYNHHHKTIYSNKNGKITKEITLQLMDSQASTWRNWQLKGTRLKSDKKTLCCIGA